VDDLERHGANNNEVGLPGNPKPSGSQLAHSGLRRHFARVPKLSTLFALLAALMLVMAGAPSRASAPTCDPCPPDCPMMAQMAKASAAADQAQHPEKGRKPDNPCKQGMVCAQVAMAPPLSLSGIEAARFDEAAALFASVADGGPSHPPDPGRRPPILL
jgi:hypothetical protein